MAAIASFFRSHTKADNVMPTFSQTLKIFRGGRGELGHHFNVVIWHSFVFYCYAFYKFVYGRFSLGASNNWDIWSRFFKAKF